MTSTCLETLPRSSRLTLFQDFYRHLEQSALAATTILSSPPCFLSLGMQLTAYLKHSANNGDHRKHVPDVHDRHNNALFHWSHALPIWTVATEIITELVPAVTQRNGEIMKSVQPMQELNRFKINSCQVCYGNKIHVYSPRCPEWDVCPMSQAFSTWFQLFTVWGVLVGVPFMKECVTNCLLGDLKTSTSGHQQFTLCFLFTHPQLSGTARLLCDGSDRLPSETKSPK